MPATRRLDGRRQLWRLRAQLREVAFGVFVPDGVVVEQVLEGVGILPGDIALDGIAQRFQA
ncbi:hypothetical protein BIV24_27000 [Streptomyces colonosanans]|uniref:Uncharacterized protein n=1 Tax=Streptomyces colonosanans TaxID=1428652 RepID=A0A1S2NXD8_9ACTN|nr:hypothetical protein BIV24_27000 [Streptomyces colonosanans]